jgi:hypothetical protein
MAHTPRPRSIQSTSRYDDEDYMWGIPESPEFSVVHSLMTEFKTHEDDEERWLSFYKRIAEESDDPTFRFLLNIIIGDEERHNQLLGRMVSSLKDDLASARAERPGQIEARIGAKARELTVMIESFLNVEKKGIKEYERLKKTSERFRQGLLALLCQTMVYDSLKHIGILNFLRLKLKEEQRRKVKRAPRTR